MKKKKLLAALLSVTLIATMGLTGCGKDKEPGETGNQAEKMDKDQHLNITLGAEPKSLDASTATDLYASQVLSQIMEGLTRVVVKDGKDVIEPAGAEKWEVSDDGLVWTFKLREYNWQDGKKVTAEEFVYGMMRTLDPKTGATYASLLYPIKNAREYNAGKAKAEEVGIKALDEKTLQFTLANPCAYFLDLTYFKVMQPQRKDLIEEHGELYGTEKETLIANGPFVIKEWVHQSKVELIKNDKYWDKDNVKLEKVTMKIITQEDSRMGELSNGSLDAAAVTMPEWVKKFNDTGNFEVLKSADPSIAYTFFNQQNKYFKNEKIRKAFILAEDRAGRIQTLFRNVGEEAYGWCPPQVLMGDKEYRDIVNYNPLETLKKESGDPKALLIEGLKEIGEDPDPSKMQLTWLESGTAARNKEFAEFAQENYKKVLGIDIKIDYVEWPQFMARTDKLDYEIASMGWTGDYNDPSTFFDMWASDAGIVPVAWKNDRYDEIIKEVAATSNQEERAKLFKEGEEILIIKDAVVSPQVFRSRQTYVRKYVKGLMYPLFGTVECKYAYTSGR